MFKQFIKLLICGALTVGIVACEHGPEKGAPPAAPTQLDVVAAASLGPVLEKFKSLFEQRHPGLEVRLRTGGSNSLARQVLELGTKADVLLLADATIFPQLLEPNWCKDHLRFASERIVLGYTRDSHGAAELTEDTWPEILLREDVKVGMADPDKAPVGYRTLMVLQLAELDRPGSDLVRRLREKIGMGSLRADVAELLAPLQTGSLDYAFVYATTAATAGLAFFDFPDSINLGNPEFAESYARASVVTAGKSMDETLTRRGSPIVYGASLNGASPGNELAAEFLALLVSDEGSNMLSTQGFISRPVGGNTSPAALLERLARRP